MTHCGNGGPRERAELGQALVRWDDAGTRQGGVSNAKRNSATDAYCNRKLMFAVNTVLPQKNSAPLMLKQVFPGIKRFRDKNN